jgi:hypothetical protein
MQLELFTGQGISNERKNVKISLLERVLGETKPADYELRTFGTQKMIA